MKVLLLGFGKIAYMPYMNFYLDVLREQQDVQIELVYWDRDGKPDAVIPACISKAYKFESYLEEQLPFRKKLKFFTKYRSFVKRILKKNNYDKVIVLHTTPGLTLLDYLRKHYNGNYVLDFRDVSHENISIYRKLVGKLVEGSALTYVSSNAFRKFLPETGNIYTIHNFLNDSLNHIGLRNGLPRKRDVIRVGYWGLVRQVDVNKKIIDALGNDSRFELHYYGRMQQDGRDMETYAKNRHYSNVYFHGAYMPEDRYSFAEDTDIIHNIYDLGHTMGNAMGNKYYDGIIFEIPQICTKGSHMGDIVDKCCVGLQMEMKSESIADKLWVYYENIDWSVFREKCEEARNDVLTEQCVAKQKLLDLFNLL